jgi:hypothetical protein
MTLVPAPRPSVGLDDVPRSVFEVWRLLVCHPVWLLRQWNWKAAVLSAASRGSLFFATNLHAGLDAAVAALLTETVLRASTAGFYGATTQAFRRAEPVWAATATVSVLLPLMTHTIEFLAHWLRQTPALWTSVVVSAVFTVVSTQFNLLAMRHDVLIVGAGSQSLFRDLRAVPRLIGRFVSALPRGSVRALRGRRHGPVPGAPGRPVRRSSLLGSTKA